MALSDLKLLSKFSLYLFLSYILDRRTRVYCKNIPINPQLDKILRIFLIPEEKKNFLKINIDFVKTNANRFKINEIFNSLDHIDIISDL